MANSQSNTLGCKRFGGYLPVVIDLETSGVECERHAILEIGAVHIEKSETDQWQTAETFFCHVDLFPKAAIDPKALEINGIDPGHPFRFAIPEIDALTQLFDFIRPAVKQHSAKRAVLVGHNAHFDLNFLQAAIRRNNIENAPLHSFTCFDTATLGAFTLQQTVLAKALQAAGIPFDPDEAHNALYDAERTAELFCFLLNNVSCLLTDRESSLL